ncbi:MAG: sulfatase-like hydrolase/transferase [Verrucomicrobiales bacterium]|nr:sulfatase-like hydrolase/transferase [bacterium]MDF2376150.1 sulfatase-like hydrolase/transferase [Verrucomicrobiales bacterium]
MRLTLLFLLAVAWVQDSPAADQPNIVLIFTDDHGWSDIGAAGIHDDLKTPHLDQLAADGVRCTNGYVTAPQCVPSRGGLLAGRDQSRFGLETNGSGLEGFNAEMTIGERLQKQGYKTGQIGKWHLGPGPQIVSHGFDEVYNRNSARPAWATYHLDGRDREPGFDETDTYHLDACSQAALAFIDRHGDDPFFLYLAYRAPHVPLDAPEKYLSRFPGKMPERRRQALAMISAMDDGVGQIREKLEEKGLTEKTLLFFIGDNGAPLKIHKVDAPGGGPGWDGSLNEPMNGEKGMLSEGGIRVPFLVAWPGRIPPGQVYEKPVISLDVAATATALAGLPEDQSLDGTNLIPFLTGANNTAPHEALFWRWSSQSAIRVGDWKFLRGGSREYLFDIVKDPYETTNLLQEKPEKAGELRSRLRAWTQELDPPGFIGGQMPEVWENYFDHYLDGKKLTRESVEKLAEPENVDGWIARNSVIKVEDGVLKLLDPDGGKRLTPFLANNRVEFDGPFQVSVELEKSITGDLGVSWREDGQKDFFSGTVTLAEETGIPPRFKGTVPSTNKVIHLRVLFPNGNAGIKSIEVISIDGKVVKRWGFQGSRK